MRYTQPQSGPIRSKVPLRALFIPSVPSASGEVAFATGAAWNRVKTPYGVALQGGYVVSPLKLYVDSLGAGNVQAACRTEHLAFVMLSNSSSQSLLSVGASPYDGQPPFILQCHNGGLRYFNGAGYIDLTNTSSLTVGKLYVYTRTYSDFAPYVTKHYLNGVQIGASVNEYVYQITPLYTYLASGYPSQPNDVAILYYSLQGGYAATASEVAAFAANPWQLLKSDVTLGLQWTKFVPARSNFIPLPKVKKLNQPQSGVVKLASQFRKAGAQVFLPGVRVEDGGVVTQTRFNPNYGGPRTSPTQGGIGHRLYADQAGPSDDMLQGDRVITNAQFKPLTTVLAFIPFKYGSTTSPSWLGNNGHVVSVNESNDTIGFGYAGGNGFNFIAEVVPAVSPWGREIVVLVSTDPSTQRAIFSIDGKTVFGTNGSMGYVGGGLGLAPSVPYLGNASGYPDYYNPNGYALLFATLPDLFVSQDVANNLTANPYSMFSSQQSFGTLTTAAVTGVISANGSSSGLATLNAISAAIKAAYGTGAGAASVAATGRTLASASATSAGTAGTGGTARSINAAVGATLSSATVAAVARLIAQSTGAAAGTAVVGGAARTVFTVSGSAAGTSTVSGSANAVAGTTTLPTDGTAVGTSTATGEGRSIANTSGNSNGVATGIGTAVSITQAVGATAGSSTAAASVVTIRTANGTAIGTATLTGNGNVIWQVSGASAGIAVVAGTSNAVAAATTDASGNAVGTSTANATGRTVATGAGTATGNANANGEGQTLAQAIAQALGASNASGTGVMIAASVGTGSGSSNVAASTNLVKGADGFAAGSSTTQSVVVIIVQAVGLSLSESDVEGVAASIRSAIATANGKATVSGITQGGVHYTAQGDKFNITLVFNGYSASLDPQQFKMELSK